MSDYNFLMESRLSTEQFALVNYLSRLAAELGLNLYLVGGAVRDLTYGQQVVRDLDFVVEGSPDRIFRRLESRPAFAESSTRGAGEPTRPQIESVHVDSQLKSAAIRCASGTRAELAMARQESYVQGRRRPAIAPSTIFDDLRRRDFSVNAMAISLHPNSRGLLLDPTNGAADIEKRELRVLHSRGFSEDGSRIYRLLRLGFRLGFKPEERTRTWFEAALQNRRWEELDADQQGRELRAVLAEENPGRVLRMFSDQGLLKGLDKKVASVRIRYDEFNKIQSLAGAVPGADPFLLNFHCLVRKLGRADQTRLAEKILPDRQTVKLALNLEREARDLARVLSGPKAVLPSRVYSILAGQPPLLLLFLLAQRPSARLKNRIKNYLVKVPQIRAKLPRAELQAMGVNLGPQFERILQQLFLDQLDGKVKTHAQALKHLKALAGLEPAAEKARKSNPPSGPKNKGKRK